jgi:O-antigen/teichoic acid export membrane protein|tara:strand:- start:1251 stop:2711 length:1461 start_codon:yes stop_codon:yes gene_type:complete
MIGFAIRLLSIFTGFIFIMLVTRQLSAEDFGTWIWISRLIGYVAFPVLAVNYWVTRFVARDFKAAKTGFMLVLILAALGTMVYLLIIPYAARMSAAPLIFFGIATSQIPLTYVKENLDSVSYGVKPQIASYGFFAFEIAKVVLAFLLMATLGPTLTSAILAVAGAQVINIVVLLLFLREDLHGIFDKGLAKRWLKVFWIPIYTGFSIFFLATFDATIVISLSGSNIILANYGAASVFFGIIMSLGPLASALYPRLLGGGGGKDIEEILKLTLLLAIPMCAGVFIIARPLLFMLNPIYVEATLVVRALIFYAFILVMMNILDFVITGSEKVELKLESTFKDFMKSRLFILPSINLLMGIFYLISLTLVLLITLQWGLQPEEIAFYWALTQLVTSIPFFTYKFWLARKIITFRIPWRQAALYILASLIMVAAIQTIKLGITYTPSIYIFIYDALKLALTGSTVYFIIVYIFDPYFRNLLRSIYISLRF